MMADMVGQQYGSYRLMKPLGEGGQASVYLAQHIRLSQKLAAVKIMHAHLPLETFEAFRKEADTIADLIHPQIVNILDFDVQQGTPFIVMEYYPNGTIRQRHRPGEQLPLPTVVSYVEQVASALQYAHDHKHIHRDVKPANLLIGSQGNLLLSDFGIATIAHSTSSMSVQDFAGTIHYMAPEQINAHARRESDQYSLAIVTYEWLTGRLPFVGTTTEIAIKHLTIEPPPLRQHLPALPAEVEKVVLKALAKEPKNRFLSVQEFATALKQAMHSSANEPTILHSLQSRMYQADTLIPPTPVSLANIPSISAPQIVGSIPASTNIALPGRSAGVQPAFTGQFPMGIDEQEVFRRVNSHDVPANWQAHRPVGSIFITQELLIGFSRCILLPFILFVLASFISIALINIGLALLTLIGLGLEISYTRARIRKKSQLVLVLLPQGIVYGRAIENDYILVANYQNITNVRPDRSSIKFSTRNKTVRVNLSSFARPEEIAMRIARDYKAFKAS